MGERSRSKGCLTELTLEVRCHCPTEHNNLMTSVREQLGTEQRHHASTVGANHVTHHTNAHELADPISHGTRDSPGSTHCATNLIRWQERPLEIDVDRDKPTAAMGVRFVGERATDRQHC